MPTTFDAVADFADTVVVTAPTPATSGTTLLLAAGSGPMPAPPFDAVVHPATGTASFAEAELVRVTAMSGQQVTAMTRAQYGTTAKTIQAGWRFAAVVTRHMHEAVHTAVSAAETRLDALEAGAGAKAPIDSPTFTGNPKAPTPPADDNDTSIATTAWVQAEIAGLGGGSGLPSGGLAGQALLSDGAGGGDWSNVPRISAAANGMHPGDYITSTLNALLVSLATFGKGIVEFEAGNYYTGDIELRTGTGICGQGVRATVFTYADGSNGDAVIKMHRSVDGIESNAFWCYLADFQIQGNHWGQTSGTGYGIKAVVNPQWSKATNDPSFDTHHTINNVEVWYTRGRGYHADGRGEHKLYNLVVRECQGDAAIVPTADSTLTACVAGGNLGIGYLITQASVRLVGCKAFYNGASWNGSAFDWTNKAGFHIQGVQGGAVVMSGCEAQDNGGPGIYIENSTGHNVQMSCDTNARAASAGQVAVDLWGGHGNIINVVGIVREQPGTDSKQDHLIRLRNGSGGNVIVGTHRGHAGFTVGSLLTSDTVTTGNQITAYRYDNTGALAETILPPTTTPGAFLPGDIGLIAANFDPALAVTTSTVLATSGVLYLQRVRLDNPRVVTNIVVAVTTAGATLTAGQNFAALYDAAGALVAGSQTADQSTAWTSTGVKTMALTTAQTLAAGYYWVALWSNGTTRPAFVRGNSAVAVNGVLAAASGRFATSNTAVTTTAPAALGTRTLANTAYWVGLS